LQALLLLNDPQYVECARALADRALRERGKSSRERIRHLFRLVTCREPDANELGELVTTLIDLLAEFDRDAEGAKKLLAIGEFKATVTMKGSELAAWTMLASTVLNLDEVLNKE
jgi:hypothetical protein